MIDTGAIRQKDQYESCRLPILTGIREFVCHDLRADTFATVREIWTKCRVRGVCSRAKLARGPIGV